MAEDETGRRRQQGWELKHCVEGLANERQKMSFSQNNFIILTS